MCIQLNKKSYNTKMKEKTETVLSVLCDDIYRYMYMYIYCRFQGILKLYLFN